MTLIVTALADNIIVQASDRRLTMPNGEIFTDRATKCIVAVCADAKFSVAYTGLAKLGHNLSQRTDLWIVDRLIESKNLSFPLLLNNIAKSAEILFSQHSRILRSRNGLTLGFAGFCSSGPFATSITNQELGDGSPSRPSCTFKTNLQLRNKKPLRCLDLMILGAEAAFGKDMAAYAAIRPIRRRFFGASPSRLATVLVELIRHAAKSRLYGKTIGEDCIGVSIIPDGNFEAFDFPANDRRVQTMPHAVLGGCNYTDISIFSGDITWEEFASLREGLT